MVTPFLAGFPAKKNHELHNASHNFSPKKYNLLLPPTSGHLIPLPHPQRVYGRTEYADVTTNLERVDN